MDSEKLNQFPEAVGEVHSTKSSSKESTDDIEIDPDAERRLLWKMDWILLPMFTLIYCTNFIDRTAIGNARIAGLEKDLGMKGVDYNIALTIFYIFFIVSEIPSNLLLKRLGSIWMAFLIICFGVIAIGAAFMRNYGDLIITRVFLGMAEGGTLPGLVYLLSRFYRRHELVLRIGIFFGTAPSLAGAFGGLLASGLLSIPDIGTVTSWRKIFLVEGIITTGIGISLLFILPNDPRTTRMFNEEERALAIRRMDADAVIKMHGKIEATRIELVLRSFKSFHTILCTTGYIMLNISFQGLSLFLPTVVNTLGHFTTVEAQLRTVPPFLVALVWAVTNSYISYRMKIRFFPIFVTVCLQVIGYSIAVGTRESHARYAACFFSVAGAGSGGPMLLAWGTDNAAPETVRVVTTALIPGLGTLGAIIAVWTYLPQDSPNFHKGNSLNLATSCTVCVLALVGWLYLRRENQKRDRGERDYRLQGKTEEEIEQLGYLHPSFRYQI